MFRWSARDFRQLPYSVGVIAAIAWNLFLHAERIDFAPTEAAYFV
jgi:hypothetical protein